MCIRDRDYDISPGRVDGDVGGRDFDSAGEDNLDAAVAVCRRLQIGTGTTTCASAQLSLQRTARRTSASLTPQSTLDFKYSETNV